MSHGVGVFSLVREAFVASPLESLKRMGVEVKATTPKGDWLQVACPCCPDQSGSASISIESGYLRCHQCGVSKDLFEWWSEKNGHAKHWDGCVSLADLLGVPIPERAKRRKTQAWPKEMTAEIAHDSTRALLEDEENEPLRTFMAKRNALNPIYVEKLRIGAVNGRIIYPQFTWDGRLRRRYRTYNPFGQMRWGWNKGGQGEPTTGFWGCNAFAKLKPGQTIWVVEGEWDLLASLNVLDFEKRDIYVVTWTGGGGSPIAPHVIPEDWRGHEVHICYDNDTFQPLDKEPVAPDETKRVEMMRRRKNLIEAVAESFLANRCKVFLRAIPINPLEKWGADLRDWVEAGGRDLDKIPCFPLEQARRATPKAKEITFREICDNLYQEVVFRCQVHAVTSEVVLVPTRSATECDEGTKPCCTNCKMSTVAPSGVIDWAGRQEQLATAMCQRNPEAWIIENVIGKPRSCTPCRVKPLEGSPGSAWVASPKEGEDDNDGRSVEVVSAVQPPLSGEMEVQGFVYPNGKNVVVWCSRITPLDKQIIDLEPMRLQLLEMVPHATNNVQDIDDYLDRRHLDISNHVTHVYGRKDIHIAMELTAHSALWMHHDGVRKRAWLDCSIIGATRSGKSVTARSYIQHLGLGQHFTMMGNFSRAGFTLGAASINGMQKMKPGLLPRNHGKMLVLDESHLMLNDSTNGREPIFPMLQAARDIGKVEGTKIYGSQSLPAAVRLVTICNWLSGGKRAFAYPCQHLLHLYGSPESLARLDFGIPVDELEEAVGPEEVENLWSQDMMRAMVIRAWNMEADSISIDKDAIALTKQLCDEEWPARYSEDLPLFTSQEKPLSLLRIAIAIANLTLSHVGLDLSSCHVRKVHVEWAAQWLEKTWHDLGYDRLSASMISMANVQDSFGVEHSITVGLGLEDPIAARTVLNGFFGELNKEELRSLTGMDFMTFEKWFTAMMRKGVFEIDRSGKRGFYLKIKLTKGGFKIAKALMTMAEDYPEEWSRRLEVVRRWMASKCMPNLGRKPSDSFSPPDLVPLDSPLNLLIHEWQRHTDQEPDRVEDQDAGA